MNSGRRIVSYLIYLALGAVLLTLGCLDIVDSFWSGMGSALIAVGALRMIQMYRYRKDAAYREKMDVETGDERNQFLRGRAWAWAGYLFILIAGVACIALRVMDQELLSSAASGAVCLMVLLYWICFMILRKKY